MNEKPEIKKQYNDAGKLIKEYYLLNNKLHREDGPAVMQWNENGDLICEIYKIHGKFHNTNGPAYTRWDDNGKLVKEEYGLNDKFNNPNGPAYRVWFKNNYCEVNLINHKLSRINGYIFRFYNNKELIYQI